jgi:cysteine desulfuration protein SufE
LSIAAALDDLDAEFDLLGDWEERYRHVIDLGRGLAPLTGAERSDANKVRGCASQVWLVTEPQRDGALRFRGDSDAHIVRGLIAILLRLFSGRAPAEILAFDAKAAFERLGLTGALSAQRSNGLFSMTERIRRDAAAAVSAA